MSASSRDCITFIKRRPFDDWGKFQFFVRVGDNQPKPAPEPVIVIPDPDIPMIEDFPAKNSCGQCTFDNELTATVCEICGNNLR